MASRTFLMLFMFFYLNDLKNSNKMPQHAWFVSAGLCAQDAGDPAVTDWSV